MAEIPFVAPPGLLADYLSSIRPLVTVICISYNHERFITASIQSVLNQTYPMIELIVIDNNSSDQSAARVEELKQLHPKIQFIRNTENIGNCRAFNQGLKLAKGRYVIDLSADDLLHPERIARQVAGFDRLAGDYAVIFSNAAFIDETGKLTGYHFPVGAAGQATVDVPSGWVFKEILASYFVSTPTMMMRKDVLESLGGYDESLSYEDFDFWVRTARNYRYHYQDEVLTSKRIVRKSLSSQFQDRNSSLLSSTLKVCYKAFDQCQSSDEYHALASRIRWFIRQCFYAEQFELAFRFKELLEFMEKPDFQTVFILRLCKWHVPINGLYRRYAQWQQNRQMSQGDVRMMV
ncbi:glycosyltransferase family 2 protein [Larkinella terrae]|uniref:Glycosyltransferase n=1 Tax=Larkinella terrae TaxID=2025311 RepID=A0A7K0EMC3_9BACT|nr:glycosyltransferase [Larkinella terrae]MRS62990.1 glycosyltransferase [Larkinella terrae]